MELNRIVRVLRESHGYSQEYMADRLGISQASYSRIERNLGNIRLSTLYKVCGILGITVRDLFLLEKRPVEDLIDFVKADT